MCFTLEQQQPQQQLHEARGRAFVASTGLRLCVPFPRVSTLMAPKAKSVEEGYKSY